MNASSSALVRIYFSGSVRGGEPGDLARRIAALERFGEVATRHMASPLTVDVGDDRLIYEDDQRLLRESDVFIGDFSRPTTGGGFMASQALALGKPVLALFAKDQPASAMLAGNPHVTVSRFHDEASFVAAVRGFLAVQALHRQLRAPKVVLAGPPGAGKGTLAAALERRWGIPHLSTGAMLRELIATQPTNPLSVQLASFVNAGQLVPAPLMRQLVLERLSSAECQRFGFLLDGYPPSRADLANLGELVPDVVFLLELDDELAVQRQVSRAARSTDTPEKARTRLSVFHAEAPSADWFPKSVTVRLDASRSAAEVEALALDSLDALVGEPRRSRSYSVPPPCRASEQRSTRVHFHVDAPTAARVRAMAAEILRRHPPAQGQLKLYPIEALHLGPQVKRLPVYAQLPNFHSMAPGADEAFLTGRLGDGDDALMRTVLDVTSEFGGMTELEEYTGEWTLGLEGTVRTDSRYEVQRGRFGALAQVTSGRCSPIPRLELHLGFDLPRTTAALPLSLETLSLACAEAGFENGGWFVFKKNGWAAYRSNEFADGDVSEGEARVGVQARRLSEILKSWSLAAEVSYSLELVHGMWVY